MPVFFISICFSLFAAPLDLKQSVSSNWIIVTAPLCHPPKFAINIYIYFCREIDKLRSLESKSRRSILLCRVYRVLCRRRQRRKQMKMMFGWWTDFCALKSIFELSIWIFYFEPSTSPRKSLSFFRYCNSSPLLLFFDWRAVCSEERSASILRLQLVKTFLWNWLSNENRKRKDYVAHKLQFNHQKLINEAHKSAVKLAGEVEQNQSLSHSRVEELKLTSRAPLPIYELWCYCLHWN